MDHPRRGSIVQLRPRHRGHDIQGRAGSDRPLIVTSGTGLLTPGWLATEDTEAPVLDGFPRVFEQAAFSAASRGTRVAVLRLPPRFMATATTASSRS